MSTSQIRPLTGQQWARFRAGIVPDPPEIGEHYIPDIRLSRLDTDGKTVIHFSTKKELSEGRVVLFSVEEAFDSDNKDLPGLVKAAEAFKKLKAKLFCVAVNTSRQMFKWSRQLDPTHQVTPIPDPNGDLVASLGIGTLSNDEPQVFVAKPAVFFLNNGVVLDVRIEDDSEMCIKCAAKDLLKKIPSILKKHNHTEELPGSLEEV